MNILETGKTDFSRLRVALVHDWLVRMRGGEKVFEIFCELFPQADVFTLIYDKNNVSESIRKMRIKTSRYSSLPFAKNKYQYFLPFYPKAVDRWNFQNYDLILSSSHCVAKGARPAPGALHVCYCHTPMRYIWDMFDEYFNKRAAGLLTRIAMRLVRGDLQKWDVDTAARVHHFIANSRHVAKRIARYYRREADVIHPPVDCDFYTPEGAREDFYLMVSALVPYKRTDLAVEAFRKLGRKLKIIGSGGELEKLRRLAPPNVEFLGWQDNEAIRRHYRACRAFIFPGEEDFGITPLEAIACGTPVIAYGKGGVTESMCGLNENPSAPTAVFFPEQTVEEICESVKLFEQNEGRFNAAVLRARALEFSRPRFKEQIAAYVTRRYEEHKSAEKT